MLGMLGLTGSPFARAVIGVVLVIAGIAIHGGAALIVIGSLLLAWSVVGFAARGRRAVSARR
jgi:hypothetical protein